MRRIIAGPPAMGIVTAALLSTAVIHLALVPEHLEEAPALGILFALTFVGAVALTVAAHAGAPHWRAGATLLLAALVAGYVGTRLVGYEEWDTLGLVTKGIEMVGLLGLAALTVSDRRASSRPSGAGRTAAAGPSRQGAGL